MRYVVVVDCMLFIVLIGSSAFTCTYFSQVVAISFGSKTYRILNMRIKFFERCCSKWDEKWEMSLNSPLKTVTVRVFTGV